jgi:hypothetical protein
MTAAGKPGPSKHSPDGPSLRSKRGVEHFRRTDDTYRRANRNRAAPMAPTGAAITVEALSTGLRQCQSESTKPCNCRFIRRCADTLRRGSLTDRRRTFPGGWGVNRDKGYRRGARSPGIAQYRRRASTPVFGRCQRVVDHPNRVDLRDTRAVPMCSAVGHIILLQLDAVLSQAAPIIGFCQLNSRQASVLNQYGSSIQPGSIVRRRTRLGYPPAHSRSSAGVSRWSDYEAVPRCSRTMRVVLVSSRSTGRYGNAGSRSTI